METLTQSSAADTQDIIAILQRLEPLIGGMDVRMRRVEGDIGTLKADIGTLRSDVSTLKTDVSTLKTDVGTLKADVSTLKADVGTLKADVGSVSTRLQKIEIEALPALRVEIAELKGRVTQLPTAIQLIGFLMAVLAIAGLTKVFSH